MLIRRSLLKSMLVVAAVTLLLLLIPLVAMQFTPEVQWSVGDFVVAAALLFCGGAAIVFGLTCVTRRTYRVAVVALAVVTVALVWAELAVGLLN